MPEIPKSREVPPGAILSKNEKYVLPPTIEDRLTNKLLLEDKYTNFRLYEDLGTIRRGMDPNNWPKVLAQSLANEHERLAEITEGLVRSGAAGNSGVILDCGCGTGRHLPWEVDNFGSVIGIDFSRAMLGIAAENIAYEREFTGAEKTRLVLGDMLDMPGIPKNSADMAICPFSSIGTFGPKNQGGIIEQITWVLKTPASTAPSLFYFTFYPNNDDARKMQREFYPNMGLKVLDTDYMEGGHCFTLSEHPDGSTFRSQRFNRGEIEEMLGKEMGILEMKKLSPAMSYVIAVPSKNRDVMARELLEALKIGRKREFFVFLAGKAPTDARDGEGNTSLAIAAERGDNEVAKRLIRAGADVNGKNFRGETPLILACENGKLEIAEMLLKNKADINEEDAVGESALVKACRKGNIEIVRLLLDNGAYVGSIVGDDKEKQRFSMAKIKSQEKLWEAEKEQHYSLPMILAAENGHADIVKLIMDTVIETLVHFSAVNEVKRIIRGTVRIDYKKLIMLAESDYAEINPLVEYARLHMQSLKYGGLRPVKAQMATERDSAGKNAIVAAAKNGHLEIVKMLFQGIVEKTMGKNGWYADAEGTTPLMAAAQNGHKTIVEFLLENKEYAAKAVNQRDRNGKTALMHALDARHFEISKTLIEAGGDVKLPESDWEWGNGNYPIHLAMHFNDSEALELTEYMLVCGANPNSVNKRGETPLFLACLNGNYETAKTLLTEGADPNKEVDGEDPLLLGAYRLGFMGKDAKKSVDLLRELVKAGADPHVQDAEGETLLHKVAMGSDAELAKVLLEEFKLDVNAERRINWLRTPLEIAYYFRKSEVAEVLISHGANYELGDLAMTRFIKKVLRSIERKTAESAG